MIIVTKMTEDQAIRYCEENDWNWDESSEILRECVECDHYVSVDDISAEREIDGITYYDLCDHCASLMENN
jgi:hypothetical protein